MGQVEELGWFLPVSALSSGYMDLLARMGEVPFAHMWQMMDVMQVEAPTVQQRLVCDHLAAASLSEVVADAGKDMEKAHKGTVDVRNLVELDSTQSGPAVILEGDALDSMASSEEDNGALAQLGSLVEGDMDTQQRTSAEVVALEDEVIHP